MFDYSRARSVDEIIAENHSCDEARARLNLSFKMICEMIRSGEIQIPYGVSVGRYAAMIRNRQSIHRAPTCFYKP